MKKIILIAVLIALPVSAMIRRRGNQSDYFPYDPQISVQRQHVDRGGREYLLIQDFATGGSTYVITPPVQRPYYDFNKSPLKVQPVKEYR